MPPHLVALVLRKADVAFACKLYNTILIFSSDESFHRVLGRIPVMFSCVWQVHLEAFLLHFSFEEVSSGKQA
jgi:hypothetical protein